MSEPFIAEVRIFAGNFAPRGWAFCNGQLLPVSQNTALFSLIGVTYGGDGRTTMALPDMQGRAPMHPGTGPGLTLRRLGEKIGTETVTLTQQQMPQHTHQINASQDDGDLNAPAANRSLARSGGGFAYSDQTGALGNMASEAISFTGGGQVHNNMQPYLGLNFIIALQGVYPQRS
ncbi:MAG: phage tail protein [Deferribacteres bacterium]|nr:phage tail protein [candidate division KSB1 bacterium]MCB9500668.1 phage tail protein [Deferribacteres bacterium]